ncbi:MAG: dTDP-4-dehydrorhamnose reductase [Syntrophales bacterium]|jgi:dTDP-4-dehydrorhamnose reductase|nr:dTDP-4-dehydrorhamnose reductase [Syntrophales bacterium]
MKILILGAKGMLGCDLLRQLAGSHQATGLDSAECDIASLEDCRRAVAEYAPDVVVDAAAYTDVDGCETKREACFAVNAEGVKNIALACRGTGALVVHFSTDYVFDGSADAPYLEDDTPAPINVYGSSKLQGERYLEEFADRWLLIRTSWLYGPCGRNFVKAILAKAETVSILEVVNDQIGSPTFTRDFASAAGVLIEGMKTGVYHLTNRGQCSWYEFACKILKCVGKTDVVVRPISSDMLKRAASRPSWSVLSTDKFTKDTGLEMRHWEVALRDYLTQTGALKAGMTD